MKTTATSNRKARRTRVTRRSAVLTSLLALALSAPATAAPDVRVLIDVSGSMKQNDPANLRVPALKLLTELLPPGTRAGIWLFEGNAQALVPSAAVDEAWKARARAAAAGIHSRGRYTHIEAGLDAATADWTSPASPETPRHVILLTDGMVDVDGDVTASGGSRARLLADGLTRLRSLGARVHSIALSEQADAALLAAVAQGTDGWFEQVDDAAALQRVFLHLLEQAAAPDGLPMRGNRFTVDTSVRELTLLVFHPADAAPLELTAPDGTRLTPATAGADVAWRHETGYDLVTLSAPRAGEWTFNAPADPDNRALVVSDLGLELGELPTRAVPGEPVAVEAALVEQTRPIARTDFLQLVALDAVMMGASGGSDVTPLPLDPATARYRGEIGGSAAPGDYELIVRANGGTFQRERHRRFRVDGPPFTFSADPAVDDSGARVVHLTITADPEIIEPASFSGLLELDMPGAGRRVLELPTLDGNEITLELPAAAAGDYLMQPWVFAETRAARALRLKPDPILVSFADGEKPAAAAPEEAPLPPPPPPPPPAFSWLTVAGVIGAGNAGLGSVLGGLWLALRRRPHASKGAAL